MTSAVAKPWSRQDFLEWEALQDERFEFVDGKVRSMVGGTSAHAKIMLNVASALNAQLEGTPCTAYAEGMKVEAAPDFFYPDALVTCEDVPDESELVPDPKVIIEITSYSTRAYDRGRKRMGYQAIASLQYYVMISQYERRVEIYTRGESGWTRTEVTEGEVTLPGIGAHLTFSDIYRKTSLAPPA
jgi:Uma2 family endonuclease